jgi:hypothetical protein
MLRCAVTLLAAPIIAASAQAANVSAVRIEVSAEGYRIQSALDSTRAAVSGQRAPTPVIGSGKLGYAVAPGDAVTIVATTPGGRVHVEVREENRVLGLAEGHSVTVRNRNGVLSFDVQRAGAAEPHFRYGGIF